MAALQALAISVREQKSIGELTDKAIERVPQVLVNAKFHARKPLEEMAHTQKAIRDAEGKLGKEGRVLVRWSGTEAKLRVMIEGPNSNAIQRLAEQIANEAKRDIG